MLVHYYTREKGSVRHRKERILTDFFCGRFSDLDNEEFENGYVHDYNEQNRDPCDWKNKCGKMRICISFVFCQMISNRGRRYWMPFMEVCIYQVKTQRTEEFETLMAEIKSFLEQQEGLLLLCLIQKRISYRYGAN